MPIEMSANPCLKGIDELVHPQETPTRGHVALSFVLMPLSQLTAATSPQEFACTVNRA